MKQENRWQRDEEKYLKDCCIKAGKELEKNSFAWDGKEKNLVVQALELNKRYEILKQENKELKIKLSSTKCYLCGEGFLTPEGTELYEEKNNYRSALEEIREMTKKYDAEVGDTIIANPIQDCYDIYCKINEILNS